MNNVSDKIKDIENILNLERLDFGSIWHRKDVARYYKFDEQEVLDLPKREFKTLIIGIKRGNNEGRFIAGEEIKTAFFCVPIEIWNHKRADFEKILEAAVNEMKEANNAETDEERNGDSAVETGFDGEGETENSEE